MIKFAAALTLVSLMAANLPASAMDSMKSSMKAPTCASGDPAVMVNMKNKTYTMADHTKMSGDNMKPKDDSMMNKPGSMASEHMSMMCKSKADAMGAEMKKDSMKQ